MNNCVSSFLIDQSWVFERLPLSTEQRQELISKLQTEHSRGCNTIENRSVEDQRCSEENVPMVIDEESPEEPISV